MYKLTNTGEEGVKCKICNKGLMSFPDLLSLREYTLTGWCPVCQEKFFNTKGFEKTMGPFPRMKGERCG